MRPHLIVLALLGSVALLPAAHAQTPTRPPSVTGRILDGDNNRATMPGVNVVLSPVRDSTMRYGAVTDTSGRFRVTVPAPGAYRLRASFIGYRLATQAVTVVAGGLDVGEILMREDALGLDQLLVETEQVRMQMRGDTLEYRADAFAVNRNATAEDLVRKMPGITVQDGQIQAQGETVRRVTVDGEEFFGNDAAAALRNLPAEAIQSVQIADRQSDQTRLTGFDDGNREKSMNLVTKPNYRNGQFGRVYGGYGTDNRFIGGGTINAFRGVHRLSVLGLVNNVGQQNFAIDDILGAFSATSGGGGGRGAGIGEVRTVMVRGGGGGGGGAFSFGGGGGGGGDIGNFFTAGQNGLTTTGAIGLNYSARLGTKTRVSGSYFGNGSTNSSLVTTSRDYASGQSQGLGYDEASDADAHNYNHRLNGRVEVNFTERDALIFTPRVSLQFNDSQSLIDGRTQNASGSPLGNTATTYSSDDLGYNTGLGLVYRRSFATPGRSFSVNFNGSFNGRTGDAAQLSRSTSYPPNGSPVERLINDQEIDNALASTSASVNLAFTERVGTSGQLQVNYNPSLTRSDSQRDAFLRDAAGNYTRLDTAYTSRYLNTSTIQRGGASYQFRKNPWFFNGGVNLQHEQLNGDQTFPSTRVVDRGFFSVLPNAMLQWTPSRSGSVRLNYRASTNTPSVTQLQDVVNNANPQQVTAGNPNLQPTYAHNLNVNLNRLDPLGGRSFLVFGNATRTLRYVGNRTVVATRDTTIRGVLLPAGAQFSTPDNLGGAWNVRLFANHGRPVLAIKSNVNLTLGGGYAQTPGTLTGTPTTTNSYNGNAGLTLSSNISPKLDFTATYGADYFASRNDQFASLDQTYTRHRGTLRFQWQAWKGLTFSTDATGQMYAGLDRSVYPSTAIVNAGLAYQMLRDERVEAKLSVNDLFNQSRSLSRTVTELYVEDRTTNILGRFVMLTLTYRLKNFGQGAGDAAPRLPGRGGEGGPVRIFMPGGGPPPPPGQ